MAHYVAFEYVSRRLETIPVSSFGKNPSKPAMLYQAAFYADVLAVVYDHRIRSETGYPAFFHADIAAPAEEHRTVARPAEFEAFQMDVVAAADLHHVGPVEDRDADFILPGCKTAGDHPCQMPGFCVDVIFARPVHLAEQIVCVIAEAVLEAISGIGAVDVDDSVSGGENLQGRIVPVEAGEGVDGAAALFFP